MLLARGREYQAWAQVPMQQTIATPDNASCSTPEPQQLRAREVNLGNFLTDQLTAMGEAEAAAKD